MAKVGDKFIIEIEEVFKATGTYMACGENLYRVKGFNSLVFDDNGLNKLEKYEPRTKEDFEFGDLVEILEGEYRGQRFHVTNSSGLQVNGIDRNGHTYRIEKFKLYNTGWRCDDFLNLEKML